MPVQENNQVKKLFNLLSKIVQFYFIKRRFLPMVCKKMPPIVKSSLG